MNGHFIGGTRKLNKHWQSGDVGEYRYWDFDSGVCRLCYNLVDKNNVHYEFAPAYVRFSGFSSPTEIHDIAGLSGVKAYDYGSSDFYPRPSTNNVLTQLPPDTSFPYQWYRSAYTDRNGVLTFDWNEWSAGPEILLSNMSKDFVVFNVQTYAFLSDRYLSNIERDKIVDVLKRNIRIPRKYEPILYYYSVLPFDSMGYNEINEPGYVGVLRSKTIYELNRNLLAYTSDDFIGRPNSYVNRGFGGHIRTTRHVAGGLDVSSDLNHYYMNKSSAIIGDNYLNALELFIPYRTFVLLDTNYPSDPTHPYAYVLHMLNSLDVKHYALRGTYTP